MCMLNIAIDGYMGSGKTSISKKLAEALRIKLLDTGAIFRGIACAWLDLGNPEISEENIHTFMQKIHVTIKFIDNHQHVFVNHKDYTSQLRTEQVSQLASKLSAFSETRTQYEQIARKFAAENDCIIEGRDIGSHLLPNATVKLFLDATPETRAKRRWLQLQEKGEQTTLEEVLKDLQERDYRDSHRKIAPLKIMPDSYYIDSTNLTEEQACSACLQIVLQHIKQEQ